MIIDIIKDWEGVANGAEFSPVEKKTARAGIDLPEDLDAHLRQAFNIEDELVDAWRIGLVDLKAAGSEAEAKALVQWILSLK